MVESFSANRRKSDLGAYYTPLSLAKSLVNWAIREPEDTMLDPSFGGCAFLIAARDRLRELNSTTPEQQVFGVDIDSSAWRFLAPLRNNGALDEQFRLIDFLSLNSPDAENDKYSSIIGNPPYIFHGISILERESSFKKVEHLAKDLPLRSSQWAYFVLHSLGFLQQGGRMAMVLPTAFIKAEYASSVRNVLYNNFSSIDFITLKERVFEGTDEQVMILLADGFKNGTSSNKLHHVDSVKKLPAFLKKIGKRKPSLRKSNTSEITIIETLPKAVQKLVNTYTDHPSISTIGSLFDIRIGTVTGANDLFLFTESQVRELGFADSYLKPILARPKFITGLSLTDADFAAYVCQNHQSYLLAIEQNDLLEQLDSNKLLKLETERVVPKNIQDYLNEIKTSVLKTSHGKTRNPWYSVRLTSVPQAFFQYMSASYPRVVINTAGVCCTNNLHRLTLKDSYDMTMLTRVALGSLSSISWLDAEILGRSYGRGVLKLEPKAISKLHIPIAQQIDPQFFTQVDQALRMGDLLTANKLVDQKLLIEGLGWENSDVESIRTVCLDLQARRRK